MHNSIIFVPVSMTLNTPPPPPPPPSTGCLAQVHDYYGLVPNSVATTLGENGCCKMTCLSEVSVIFIACRYSLNVWDWVLESKEVVSTTCMFSICLIWRGDAIVMPRWRECYAHVVCLWCPCTFVSKAMWYRTFKKLDCSLI